jgi:hypothetical protein
MALHISNVI